MKQCQQCNQEFESKRTDAKYCSAKCRVTANRVTDNVTDNPAVGVTDNKPTFDDLPLDVQRDIIGMCYETTGQRQASHTRAAMTERALHYQATMGKRYAHGATCV